MKRLLGSLLLVVTLLADVADAELVVIVNTQNTVQELTPNNIIDLYMGRTRTFPSGEYALVFDAARGSRIRAAFFANLVGISEKQANTYWSRLMFTGQVVPPQTLADERSAIALVERNPSAIAYVSLENIPPGSHVRVVASIAD